MIFNHKKMPGHRGPGKFEELVRCDMYRRRVVGATIILT